MAEFSRIPHDKVEEVLRATDLVEVVGQRVRLTQKGKDWWGLCPFHGDKDPSFSVNREKGMWYCFGCGEGGNAFQFLMRDQHLSYPEAVRELARAAGVVLPSPSMSPEEKRQQDKRDRLLHVVATAAKFFTQQLAGYEGKAAREYLFSRRGLSPETAADFALGWAPDQWEACARHLAGKGISQELAVEAGLLVPSDKGSGAYDRFRGRVIFPIRDGQGRPISLGGRILAEGEPKYLNGPESPVFSKSRTLYNLDRARPLMRRLDRALLVEGYFDVITCAAHGFGETVAPLGTALTAQQARAIKGQAREVVLVFDGDQAGRRAARRALPILLAESLPARVLLLPPGDDPDTFLRSQGPEAFATAIKEARPLMEMALDDTVDEGDRTTPEGRSQIVAQAGELLSGVRDPVTRDGYLRRLAAGLGLEVAVIAARLGLPAGGMRRSAARPAAAGPACLIADDEAARLQLALADPGAARVLLAGGALGDLAKPEHQAIAQAIGQAVAQGQDPTPTLIGGLISDPAPASALARLMRDAPPLSPNQVQAQANSCLALWNKRRAKQRRAALKQDLAAAQATGDQERLALIQARRAGLDTTAPAPAPAPSSSSDEKD